MYLLLVIKTLIMLAGTPAYLLLPDTASGEVVPVTIHAGDAPSGFLQQHPAIVVLHDHGAHYAIGKEKLTCPDRDVCTTMSETDFDHTMQLADRWVHRLYDDMYVADSLAALGYVVLVHDCPGWGTNTIECGEGEWPEAILQSDREAFNYLYHLPQVDSTEIYATGFSMGGYRAWMLAASEPRVAGCAAFHWMQSMPCTKDWCLPADYVRIASSIAPRPFLLVMGQRDRLFPIDDARECAQKIQQAYSRCGSTPMFEYLERDDDHHFGDDAWEILKYWLSSF